MTEDANHAAVLAVLTDNGVTSPNHDLDTLATLIVAAFNNPASPAAVPDDADPRHGSTEG